MPEIPVRFPPQVGGSYIVTESGERVPVIQAPVIECGMVTRLGGQLVQCIRRAGHPVRIDYAHSNGYSEWCFDDPALIRNAAGEWVEQP